MISLPNGRFIVLPSQSLRNKQIGFLLWIMFLTLPFQRLAAEHFTIGTFNLENYTDSVGAGRTAKSELSRRKVREAISALHADVLGLQEIGDARALEELRAALEADGLKYPYWEHVVGYDTNIFVAVLSRFPIVARRSPARDSYLLHGRRFRMSRGVAEVDVRVNLDYIFTFFVAHLKSRRPSAEADEEEIREQEAILLRECIDARLRASPGANIAVVGDLNDVPDARSTRTVIGKGKRALVDTRPSERSAERAPMQGRPTKNQNRTITWTYFYGKEDTYSRIDYILLNSAMAQEWHPSGSFVLNLPDWGLASDHRPVLIELEAQDR